MTVPMIAAFMFGVIFGITIGMVVGGLLVVRACLQGVQDGVRRHVEERPKP